MDPLQMLMIFAGLAAAGLFFVIFDKIASKRERVKKRLTEVQEISTSVEDESEYRKPFSDRILKPMYQNFLAWITRLTPKAILNRYDELLTQAGLRSHYTPIRMIGIQLLLGIFTLLIALILIPPGTNMRVLLILTLSLVLFMLPYLMLLSQAKARLIQIDRTLPDLLDLLYVSVEAGLSFDMALRRTAEKTKGPLADEVLQALTEMSKGRDRKDALRGIAERTKSSDLTTFISSVIQAEQLGSNIANTLRIQSSTMRQKRAQRAEEQAAKLATKMLFPIVFMIFPALLLVLLGPTLIRLLDMMTGLF